MPTVQDVPHGQKSLEQYEKRGIETVLSIAEAREMMIKSGIETVKLRNTKSMQASLKQSRLFTGSTHDRLDEIADAMVLPSEQDDPSVSEGQEYHAMYKEGEAPEMLPVSDETVEALRRLARTYGYDLVAKTESVPENPSDNRDTELYIDDARPPQRRAA